MIDYKKPYDFLTNEEKNEIIIKFGLKKLTKDDLKRDDIKNHIVNNYIKRGSRIMVK